jgi:hypothetical protein
MNVPQAVMRAGHAIIVTLVGCGRVGFDATPATGDGPSGSYVQAVLADHPVAYWRLDEVTGSVAHDTMGSYPGTYQGACTLGAVGALSSGDRAVELDGHTCRIPIGDVLDFAGETPFSIDLWVDLAVSDTAVRWLVSDLTTPVKNGYSFAFVSQTLWLEQDEAGSSLSYVPTTLPSVGEFHHIAVTNDGTRQRIYVDGVMSVEKTFTVTQPSGTGPLVLGDYEQGDPAKLEGRLDDVAVYAAELSASTIAAHFAAR